MGGGGEGGVARDAGPPPFYSIIEHEGMFCPPLFCHVVCSSLVFKYGSLKTVLLTL